MLPKDLKEEFHDRVNRATPKAKITDLINGSPEFVKTMNHEERLRIIFNYNPLLGFLGDHGKLWEQLAFINCFCINFIIVSSYSEYFVDEGLSEEDPGYNDALVDSRFNDPRFGFEKTNKGTLNVILTFGLMDLVFASLIVFFFLIKRAPLKIYSVWEDFAELKVGFFKLIFLFWFKVFKSLFILLQDFDILYYSCYILAGIIGLTVHPFFFAIHLMDFLKLDQLKTVV
jgi:hypothetical protein